MTIRTLTIDQPRLVLTAFICLLAWAGVSMVPQAASGGPLMAKQVSTGEFSTCAILNSGQAVCWGENQNGRLGDGTSTHRAEPWEPTDEEWVVNDRVTPVRVVGLTDARQISVGISHACAIRNSGQAVCWGQNDRGQLGDGTSSHYEVNGRGQTVWIDNDRLVPVPVKGLNDAISISAGRDFTCAVRISGQAVCWGSDELGVLGRGVDTQITDPGEESDLAGEYAGVEDFVPAPVTGLSDALSISAGSLHACAVRASGQAVCWGSNWHGRLGNGWTSYDTEHDSDFPVPVWELTDATAISAGQAHTCAIRVSGQAVCWGLNAQGRLGNGLVTIGEVRNDSSVPVPVSGLSDASSIATGQWHSCAVRTSGQAVCWGANSTGSLGNGTLPHWEDSGFNDPNALDPVPVPSPVDGLSDATSIATSIEHVCSIRTNGGTYCWGPNTDGQIGDGTKAIYKNFEVVERNDRAVPTAVSDRISMPALGRVRVEPGTRKVKRGRRAEFIIWVTNKGTGPSIGARVCASAPKRLLKLKGKSNCQTLDPIYPKGDQLAIFHLTLKKKAKRGSKAKVRFTVSGGDLGRKKVTGIVKVR